MSIVNPFDSKAAEWDDNPARREMNRAVAAAIRDVVPLDLSMFAMDFGCGTGLVSRELFPSLGKITAVDQSSGMIEELEKRLEDQQVGNISVRCLDLFTDPMAEQFDLIYSVMALHHVQETDRLLDLLTELLRPGGWIALADLDAEDGSFHQDVEGFVHHGFDREELMKSLELRGFCTCSCKTAHTIEKETGSYPIFLFTAQLSV